MLLDVMAHYGLEKEFGYAGFFETEHHRRLFQQLKKAIPHGQLIALSGMVGSGKTTTLEQLQTMLRKDGKVIVSKSVYVEKNKTTLTTLITALFYDISGSKDYAVPKQGERRDRELQELIRTAKKPVALFIDEAHDLHHHTLTGLKRLMEAARDGGGKLSIVLAGHPKLKNDLNNPSMEEVGYRTVTLSLDSMQGSLREYLLWLLKDCTSENVKTKNLIDDAAIDLLTEKLSTPLQIEKHLTLALEEAYKAGGQPVTIDILDLTLSKRIDDLEPTLVRNGYDEKVLGVQFRLKPAEVRRFLAGDLDAARAHELVDQMREAGLPI